MYWLHNYQDIVGRVWTSCMHFSHWRENGVSEGYQGDNSYRKLVVVHNLLALVYLDLWHRLSCQQTCQHNFIAPSSWSCLLLFGLVFCMFNSFLGSSPINAFYLPHVPLLHRAMCYQLSTSPNWLHCNFHMFHVIVSWVRLQYGVTDRHRLTTNSVGLAHEHN